MNLIKANFIILGMVCIIIALSLPPNFIAPFIEPAKTYSLSILINFFSATGSILIVGGIFEVIFKDQFIKEVNKDFIKALFLDKTSLHHFSGNDLLRMKQNIQEELLGNHNNYYKSKFLKMINESFFKIAQGTHNNQEFNMFYDSYNVVIYIKKSTDEYVDVEYDLKYRLTNNNFDGNGTLVESENNVFAKRFFPPFAKTMQTQEVTSLIVKIDGNSSKDYSSEIQDQSFMEQTINQSNEDDVRAIQEDVKKQIQQKNPEGNFEPFLVKFKESLVLEKKIKIKTLYKDINYVHIFKRPVLNYSIHFIDENVDTEETDVDYLSLRLFSGLNKKNNDKIHPVLKGNSISLTVSDELLLPGEGISILSFRNDWNKRRTGNDGNS